MDLGIEGRVALVLGASKGIGRAVATELAAEGARVAIASRSREGLDELAGQIDVLVTNTGGPPASADPLAQSREEWEAAYRTLVLAPLALVRAVLPGMRERGFGRIVNIGSWTVREPLPNLMLSNSHRSATFAAFKTIAREVASSGVTLNTVLPGRIGTDRLYSLSGGREQAETIGRSEVPAGRLGTPQEMAAAVAFLCSARASYITGVGLLVDGGLSRLT